MPDRIRAFILGYRLHLTKSAKAPGILDGAIAGSFGGGTSGGGGASGEYGVPGGNGVSGGDGATADKDSSWWNSIKEWLDERGMDRRNIYGGLGGAALGGLAGYMLGDDESPWGSAALGALGGGALGAYGGQYLPKWWKDQQKRKLKGKPSE